MTNSTWKRHIGIGSAFGLSAALAAMGTMAGGCDQSSSTNPPDGGADSTSPQGDGASSDAPSSDAGSLYLRLGRHAGIRTAVDAIVAAELQNADIASYFFFQQGAPGNGHPTADQVAECFTDLVGFATGGSETYPTTVTTDAGSFTCRGLQTIHAPLLISGGTFDTFVMIAGQTLASAGVSSADIMTLANDLTAAKSQVVTASLMDAGLQPFPGDGGAPGEGGAPGDGGADAGTLYQRLGGHSGIRTAVNAIVAAELQNADIASYFFFQQGAPGNGHPTADQVEECFTDLVGNAAGGPEVYPTTITTDAGMYTCRSLAAIHAPLLISGGTFDTFVMIAGQTLTSAGVSSADVTTLANVLNGTKSQVVTTSLADAGLEPFPGDAGGQ